MAEALLFLDMLGVRSLWHRGGAPLAEEAFQRLQFITASVLDPTYYKHVLAGEIQGDSVALVCRTVRRAAEIGSEIFKRAFLIGARSTEPRIWLRGIIVACDGSTGLIERKPLGQALGQVLVHKYSSTLLEAISAEKSGIKGMRLLVKNSPSGRVIRRQIRLPLDDKSVSVAKRSQHLPYPPRLSGYRDVLWMACQTEEQWNLLKARMDRRMRWAAPSSEEFVHAAATQVLFSECGGFIGSVKASYKNDGLRVATSEV